MNHNSQTKQICQKSRILIIDHSSVFNCNSKPLTYIKGDTVHVLEFTEESWTSTKNCSNLEKETNSMKKYSLGGMVEGRYNNFNGDELKKNKSIENSKNNSPISQQHHATRHAYSNNKLDAPTFGNPPIECWETKSQNEEENFHPKLTKDHDKYHRTKTEHLFPSYFLMGTKCENSKDAYIYSWSKFNPFSFLWGANKYGKNNKGILNYPSPTFIETSELQKKPDLSKKAILYGMEVHDKDGLVLVDKDIMKKFKGIIADMIKQILKAAFGTPISLKVQLFEPKSTLQRISDYWSFAPQFLLKAANSFDPLERMKYVIAFVVSGFYIPTKQLKPFNPLLGETFEGSFEDGSKVYIEHISHYPTVARFLVLGEYYKIHGYFDFSTSTESFGSKINVFQKGPITVEFPKIKQKVIYNMPVIKLINASSEEGRSAIWHNTILFSDTINNLKAVVKLGTNKNYIHGFEGYIIENNFNLQLKYDHSKELEEVHEAKLDYENKKMKNKILSKINGSWLKELKFNDSECIWDINTHVPNWIRPSTNVLPSDGRFREDLIWLYRTFNADNDIDRKTFTEFSQGWKVTIEQTQRGEREVRKKNRPKKK